MQNVQVFLVLNVYALIIIIITSIIYFKKERQMQIEDITYSKLLVITILLSVSGIFLGIIVNPQISTDINLICFVNKVYLIFLSLWIMILTFYTFCISLIKNDNIFKVRKLFKIITIFNIAMILLLPITVKIGSQNTISTGWSIFYTYAMFGIGFLCQIICIVIDRKNIKKNIYQFIH